MNEDDTTLVDDATEAADFASGFTGKPADKPAKKDAPATETPQETDKPAEPKYVQITEEDWNAVKAAAAKTASYDKQLSTAHGNIGNLQRTINELRAATPQGVKVTIPKDAFAEMEKDFPELAAANRSALEKALSGITGAAPATPDDTRFTTLVSEHTNRRELEHLEDEFPDWRDIVSAGDKPDPDNAYRKWLGTKDATYQQRINETDSAATIARSIVRFKRETAPPPVAVKQPLPAARAESRREQLKEAVQPRGDGAAPSGGASEDDDFVAGFKNARS